MASSNAFSSIMFSLATALLLAASTSTAQGRGLALRGALASAQRSLKQTFVVNPGGAVIEYLPQQAQPAASVPVPTPAPVPAPQPQQAATPVAPSSGGLNVLELHNQLRAQHQAPPLTWSSDLVASAQSWANNLASNCAFYHSGPGENLASGYSTWDDVVMAWYNEINQYNYNAPGYSSATGHATQLLWVATTQLGCATAVANCWEAGIYVCHYNPVGNVNSAAYFKANVLP